MVREEILRRQLLAAEDQLIAALKHGGLEEFMHQWASLQTSIAVGAEQGQLSDELLILNDSICQDVGDIVQSCLAVEDGINQAFNANDIPSDFTLSNEGQDASTGSDTLRASVANDDGVSSPSPNKPAQQSKPNDGNTYFQRRSLLHEGGDFGEHGYDSDDFIDQATWEDEDWESDEGELDEPDPDWDKMQGWFLANIAYPFLDPHHEDPIIESAPISPDHLEMWVSEICDMCNWQEVYSLYAFNDRSRMETLCDVTFGLKPSQRTTGTPVIPKEVQNDLWSMRESAIAACDFLQQSRANITVDLERMAYMLSQLPVGAGVKEEDDPEEWSAADSDAWAAEIIKQYNQLMLSSNHSPETYDTKDVKCKSEPASKALGSKLGCDAGESKPQSMDQEGTSIKSPLEDEPQPPSHEIAPLQTVPTTLETVTGTKRKLEEYLAQSNMDDPRHPVTPLLSLISQRDTSDFAQHHIQGEVSTDSHRSKRKRSNSPSPCAHDSITLPYVDDPDRPIPALLSPLSPASPGVSSPSSQSSSSSGSDSGSPYYSSPPADQNSPSDIPPCSSPIHSHHSLPEYDAVELDHTTSSPQHSSFVDAPHVASAASGSITPTTPYLLISSNNMTAYSPKTYSPYSQPIAPKYTPYPDNNPTLFKKDDPSRQVSVATDQEIHPTQVQVTFPEVDGQKETLSRPHRKQVPIKRKRTRVEFEVELDYTEYGSPSASPPQLSSLPLEDTCISKSKHPSLRYYKPRNVRRKRRNKTLLSSAYQLPPNLGEGIPHQLQVDFKLSFTYPRADLDKRDVRPTKRAYLAPRDYSLSPDT